MDMYFVYRVISRQFSCEMLWRNADLNTIKKMTHFNLNFSHNEFQFTNIPASIDERVFRWYSGLNQKHDVKVSTILIFADFIFDAEFLFRPRDSMWVFSSLHTIAGDTEIDFASNHNKIAETKWQLQFSLCSIVSSLTSRKADLRIRVWNSIFS